MKPLIDDPLKTLVAEAYTAGRVAGLREAEQQDLQRARVHSDPDLIDMLEACAHVHEEQAELIEADATKEKGPK